MEDLLIQVRDILRKDEIKLWLPPYFTEAGGSCKAEISVSFCWNLVTCLERLIMIEDLYQN